MVVAVVCARNARFDAIPTEKKLEKALLLPPCRKPLPKNLRPLNILYQTSTDFAGHISRPRMIRHEDFGTKFYTNDSLDYVGSALRFFLEEALEISHEIFFGMMSCPRHPLIFDRRISFFSRNGATIISTTWWLDDCFVCCNNNHNTLSFPKFSRSGSVVSYYGW